MEKRLQKIKYLLPFFAFLFVAGSALGYDNLITHPQISVAATEIFQGQTGKSLTQDQIWWIKKGSIDEDAFPRYSNHYYDPTTGRGLDDIDELLGRVTGISAKAWAQDQSGVIGHTGDYSAPAILENYRIGNKGRAYEGIGHILHLMQDMSVPAHTRNDAHAEGDPYENWAKQNGGVDASKAIFIGVNSLDQAFDELALYSHNNFLSKSSIKVTDTNDYEIIEEAVNGIKYKFLAKSENGEKYRLCLFDDSTITATCKIDNGSKFNKIHLGYWNLLHPKAVGYSAGVIDYFFKEFEGIDKEKQNQSFSARLINSFTATAGSIGYMWGDTFMSANEPLAQTGLVLVKAWNSFSSFAGNLKNLLPAQLAGLFAGSAPEPTTVVSQEPFGPALPPAVVAAPDVVAAPAPAIVIPPVVSAPIAPQQVLQPVADTPAVEQVFVPSPVPTPTPIVETVPPPADPAPVYRGSGSVTGISPDALIAQNNPTPQQQEESVGVSAFSTSTEETLFRGTTTTDAVATSSEDIIATSTDPIIDEAATSTNSVIVDTTSTGSVVPVITDFKNSIVINEIAWMGTKAQANDEWIELYNKTNNDIDLAGWTIESRNKALSVALKGVISANGYFLLERTTSMTTDQTEHMVYTGALNNAGPDANLYLKNGTTTIDFVGYGSSWFAGDNGAKRTMERVSPYAASALSANWKTYSEALKPPFAKDANGNDILGTPGKKNSVSGFYTPTGNITENTTWRKTHSPYYVSARMEVQGGATLTIEPGVVVKFEKGFSVQGGGIDVYGALHAEGAAEDPVIFTSFLDDAADGIDSNADGAATTPSPGDWVHIDFYGTTTPSMLAHAIVKYGGQHWYSAYTGAFSIYGAQPKITDSLFDENLAASLYVKKGGHPVIERTTIRNVKTLTHSGAPKSGFGIRIADADSTADIIGNSFIGNDVAISSVSATSTPLTAINNVFSGNRKNGEFLGTDFNVKANGNVDANKKGGWDVRLVVSAGQERTLFVDTMPYIFDNGMTVEEGGVLVIEPGAVIKSKNPSASLAPPFVVRGALQAQGTAEKPIVFTAFADDSDGYDSDDAIADPAPGAWENVQFIGAASSGSVLEYVAVRYGGRGNNTCPNAYFAGPCMEYSGAVRVVDADPTISNALFENNLGIAVFIEGAAHPMIKDSTIRHTQEARKGQREMIGGFGISIGPEAEPVVENNTYANNAEDVVYRE